MTDLFTIACTAAVFTVVGAILTRRYFQKVVVTQAVAADGRLTITYQQDGQVHTLTVPWNVDNVILAQDRRVHLVIGEQDYDITHDPAIPYAYSAADLTGDQSAYFQVVDLETGVQVSTSNPVTECFKEGVFD